MACLRTHAHLELVVCTDKRELTNIYIYFFFEIVERVRTRTRLLRRTGTASYRFSIPYIFRFNEHTRGVRDEIRVKLERKRLSNPTGRPNENGRENNQ